MSVALAAQAASFDQDGIKARPAATPSRGSTELASWWLELSPGAQSPPHTVDHEEIFLVVAGELTAQIGDQALRAGEGDALIVPRHTLFHIANRGGELARVACVTPAGMQASVGDQQIVPPWSR